jgi:integrase
LRRQTRQVVPTFETAARAVHADNRPTWRNAKHADQWINTLVEYVFPLIGTRPVNQIAAPDLLTVLAPIWLTKPETARRVRQRISTVLDWAKAAGHRTGDNPVTGIAKGLPKQPERSGHHAAIPYSTVPAFIETLRKSDSNETVRLAFEFLILTAARTGEVIGAKNSEVDLAGLVWTVPAERMKGGRPHRVPLVPRAAEILNRARQLNPDSSYVFAGRKPDQPLSNMAFLMAMRRMGVDATAHGFRSAFRDWASERTNFPNEVCELALAHSIKSKVEAAYRRGDQLEKRRALMEAWAAFTASSSGKVVRLRA